MIRRTLMQRNQELVDFSVDPTTGEIHVIEALANDKLLSSMGLKQQDGRWFLDKLIERRAISPLRKDKDQILAAFGAKSPIELACMGHGLSLVDQFWYRSPSSIERWEDINFFDHGWDKNFGVATFVSDYANLTSCSLDVPEVTSSGHAIKAWEQYDNDIFLVKMSEHPDGNELIGAKLASDLCALLFNETCSVPLELTERYNKPCSISPLMLAPDEELVDGNRLFVMAGMQNHLSLTRGGITTEACEAYINAFASLDLVNASAHVAKMACFSCLSLLLDFNPSNFGAIRSCGSGTWRAAPIFDYDGSFSIPSKGIPISEICENPLFVELFCASRFSFLKPSWDWTWYNPQALDGFEERILEAYACCQDLPHNYAELIARLFIMQREYVTKTASNNEA